MKKLIAATVLLACIAAYAGTARISDEKKSATTWGTTLTLQAGKGDTIISDSSMLTPEFDSSVALTSRGKIIKTVLEIDDHYERLTLDAEAWEKIDGPEGKLCFRLKPEYRQERKP